MNRKRKKQLIIDIIIAFILALLVFGGFFVYNIYFSIQEAQSDWYEPIDDERSKYGNSSTNLGGSLKDLVKGDSEGSNKQENIVFLLTGADSRGGRVARSDTIMIANYNVTENKVFITSIPRDTYVEIPGRGHEKLNHAFAYGQSALMAVTLENFLDIKIDKYVSINFEGFIDLIDAIGGVTIDVEKNMYWYDTSMGSDTIIDLKKGLQVLNGKDALGYARFRHDSLGDFGRMRRQQTIIKAFVDELKKPENITKASEIIKIVGKNMKSDLTMDDVNFLIMNFIKNPNISVEFQTLTGTGFTSEKDGLYYLRIPDEQLEEFKEKFKNF